MKKWNKILDQLFEKSKTEKVHFQLAVNEGDISLSLKKEGILAHLFILIFPVVFLGVALLGEDTALFEQMIMIGGGIYFFHRYWTIIVGENTVVMNWDENLLKVSNTNFIGKYICKKKEFKPTSNTKVSREKSKYDDDLFGESRIVHVLDGKKSLIIDVGSCKERDQIYLLLRLFLEREVIAE